MPYLQSVTHDPGPNVVFAAAQGDPAALAHRIAIDTKRYGTAVRDIRQQPAQTVSSITTVDLRGISRIEEAFALLLAAAAMALFVAVGLAERRQELATMAAVGASLRQAAAFLWSEAALVLAAALALAALLGWLLAEMLVAMLQHVFDPPPDHLAPPGRSSRARRRRDRRRPARRAARRAGNPAAPARRDPSRGVSSHTQSEMLGHTVLIVEDDPELRGVLGRGLREEGFEVETVGSGHEALERVDRVAPDVLVIDIGLPDADGRDLCQALRARGIRRRCSS